MESTVISDRGDFDPFWSSKHSPGIPTLPMSTNNSNCWCLAIALGPDKTSVTCSAVVRTTGVKEQHREGRMHFKYHVTGPALSSVYRHGSTPIAPNLMKLLAASSLGHVRTAGYQYL